jgi:hypothetical protein
MWHRNVGVSDRFSNSPNGANVDTLDISEGQDASKKRSNHDEDARGEKKANNQLALDAELDLPQKGQRDADDGKVGPGSVSKAHLQRPGINLRDVEHHQRDIVGHSKSALV